jgi:hypothetical protein
LWLLLGASASTGWAASARADDTEASSAQSPDAKAAAQALFDEGRSLVKHQQFAEACPKFAESQRLDPGIGTELWLADCYENNGQVASAWAAFKEAAAAAALSHDKREGVARDRAAALESKIPRLMVLVSDAAASEQLEVRRDGMLVASTAWGFALPVDPGAHTIAASAVGHVPWSTTVQVPARPDTLQVTIPALDDLPPPAEVGKETVVEPPGAPRAAIVATPPENPAPPRDDTSGAGTAQRVGGIVLGGAGLLGVAVGTFFSFDAKSTYDASNHDGCLPNNQCLPSGMEDRNRADKQALVATVAMGLGAAAMVSGALLYFFAPSGGRGTSVAIAPEVHGAGIRAALAW